MEIRASGQRYVLGIWIAMSVLTPLVGFLGQRGFAAVVGLLGLLVVGLARPKAWDWAGLGLLAALSLWAAISILWSPAPNVVVQTAQDVTRLTALHLIYQLILSGSFVLVAGRVHARTAQTALMAFGYGLATLAAILVVEGLENASLYQALQNLIQPGFRHDWAVRNVAVGGFVVATLFWPAAIALKRRWGTPAALGLGGAVIFSTVFLRGDSPSAALVLSAVAFAAVYRFGRPAIMALAGLATTYWLSAPVTVLALHRAGLWDLIYGRLPPSWQHRVRIWTFVDARIFEHPLRGWGIDASRFFKTDISLHPHDGALQAAFELGLPGAALLATFFVFLFWRVAEAAHERLYAAAACAALTVYLVIGAISFSLWQEWWICLGALAMAATMALRRTLLLPAGAPA